MLSQQLALCTAVGQACVCVGWGGFSSLCQPVSVPLHKPQWTDRMSYDPDALVTTAALKYLPWAGPSFTFSPSLSLCLSVSLSVTQRRTMSSTSSPRSLSPLTTLHTLNFIPFLPCSRHVEEAINSSAVNQRFCSGVIDDI